MINLSCCSGPLPPSSLSSVQGPLVPVVPLGPPHSGAEQTEQAFQPDSCLNSCMSGAPGGPAIQRQHDHETAKHRELGGGTTPGEEGVVAWEAQAEPRPRIPVLPFKRRQGRLAVEPCHPRLHPPRLHLHGFAQALAPDTDQCSGTVTLPQICPAPQPHFSLPPTCLEPEEVAPPLSPPLLKSGMTS